MVSTAEMGVQTMNEQSENKATSKDEINEQDLDKVSGGTAPAGANKVKLMSTPSKAIVLDLNGKPMGYPPNTFDGGPSSE
jgi:hypothetical protein